MSRFAVNPKWLIYLPPTMSPSETSARPGLLEHPAEAFSYFRNQGVPTVVCEEKHMGSRAVLVVCRDEEAANRWPERIINGCTFSSSCRIYARARRCGRRDISRIQHNFSTTASASCSGGDARSGGGRPW